jgi:PhnB protein
MALLNPYLTFAGNARDAMETYREIFGGNLDINTFGDYGATGEGGPAPDGIMHARLESDDGFTLMASDAAPGQDADPNGWVSLSGDEGDTLRRYFEALADGGKVVMPLERQMWGDEFGQCFDRFGVGWMVNITDSAGGAGGE